MAISTETILDTADWTVVRETLTDATGGVVCVTERATPKPGTTAATEGATVAALDSRLDQALAGLRTYINTASPTTAQTTAVVKLLCRVAVALIRRQRNALDGTD
jgi:hypothetical protein